MLYDMLAVVLFMCGFIVRNDSPDMMIKLFIASGIFAVAGVIYSTFKQFFEVCNKALSGMSDGLQKIIDQQKEQEK